MPSSYSFLDIKNHIPEAKQYFFDANVWILILSPPLSLKPTQLPYINFFDGLTNLRYGLIKMKKKGPLPEIIISPLLISEIFNTSTRLSFNLWKEDLKKLGSKSESEIKRLDYKKDYRKEAHYDLSVRQFKSDFLAHREILKVMDDVNLVDPLHILENFPANTDFNDEYYYAFCYENKISIVTNDGDFIKPLIPIITNNHFLLSL